MHPGYLAIVVPVAAFGMVVLIVWIASREKQSRARYRAEVQRDLIAKFASGQELTEFLKSEGSRALLRPVSGSRGKRR